MRLFVVSLLALASVQAGPLYGSALFSYSPARGEFPVHSGLAQGYVRYLDGSGSERLIGYKYPDPLYGVRSLSIGQTVSNPLLRTAPLFGGGYLGQDYYAAVQESSELVKAREDHFRAWCEERYRALKTEYDRLLAEGKRPSTDMINQLRPLELIMTASSYSTISESPEVKREREEHLRIWNEARLKVLQQESEHLRLQGKQPADMKPIAGQFAETEGGYKTYGYGFEKYSPIEETLEQKKAREEHLRIYNEQILRHQQLEAAQRAEGLVIKQAEIKSTPQQFHTHTLKETPEVVKAKEEHLRLWNEAKLRAEKEGSSLRQNDIFKTEDGQQFGSVVLRTDAGQGIIGQIQTNIVQDTPEVQRAREEHLKLVQEAKLRAQTDGSIGTQDAAILPVVPGVQQPIQTIGSTVLKSSLPAGIVQETATRIESTAATSSSGADTQGSLRDENLKTVNADNAMMMGTIEDESMRKEQQRMEMERMRDAERMREEEKMLEAERLREEERRREEARLMEEERLRLMKEEDMRLEMERMEEAKRLKEDEAMKIEQPQQQQQQQQQIPISGEVKTDLRTTAEDLTTKVQQQPQQITQSQTGSTSGFVLSEQQKANPYFVRFAQQPISATRYVIGGATLPSQAVIHSHQPAAFYLPTQYKTANPFLLNNNQQALTAGGAGSIVASTPQATQQRFESSASLIKSAAGSGSLGQQIKPIEGFGSSLSSSGSFSSSSSSSSSSSAGTNSLAGLKISYGEGVGLSELEKATRDHFRAHELALEQLRVANSNPHKDC